MTREHKLAPDNGTITDIENISKTFKNLKALDLLVNKKSFWSTAFLHDGGS